MAQTDVAKMETYLFTYPCK